MLIKALCDYYDILKADGQVLPDGYSNVNIHYIVSLTEAGKIEEILPYQRKEEIKLKNGKTKEKWVPRVEQLPKRTEKPGIDANIIEHRPLYLFGLNYAKETLSENDRTGKAAKSHEACVTANLRFIENLDSPVINTYRQFLLNWNPKEEVENKHLLELAKQYTSSGFAFCLSGFPDLLLHNDPQIKAAWEQLYMERMSDAEGQLVSQCAISGEKAIIARIHNKIKGVYGGNATGNVLVSFKNPSESSYGNEQSYNSNISEAAMKKYSEALNTLLRGNNHKIVLDDVTIVFWAMKADDSYEDRFFAMINGGSDKMNAEATETMMRNLLNCSKIGDVTRADLDSFGEIDEAVDFYMVGLKPNSSRLSVKFIYKKKYADVLWNIANFQEEVQISKNFKIIPFYKIKGELLSPNSTNEKINPAIISKLFEAMIYGTPFPATLLETLVRRVKTDIASVKVNDIRAGLIKGYINRKSKKEELKVALDKENRNQAYLCGRLFAVLEWLQQNAATGKLNRTIRDSYFASAASKPGMIFPKLLLLAQNHLNKLSERREVFCKKLIGEILDPIDGKFPDTLRLEDQGRFIIGYYHQMQDLFEKKEK